ncbi:hypothetical protein [Streptomyces sp. NPDC047525]|uniref:hypothetical protein n=1 Tax=Streptomyces sp. NPDC047525 TaxID=3155264 RepID=UPI0033DC5E7A
MDAGLAAVLGAVVGAAGTGTAGFLTGWWNARTAQRQSQVQADQARWQLHFEHTRDLREPRRRAYTAFIAQTRLVDRELGRYNTSTEYDLNALHTQIERLDHLGIEVMLEGPDGIVAPAQQVIDLAHKSIRPLRLVARAREDNDSDALAAARNNLASAGQYFAESVREFTHQARTVLSDDGGHY